VAQNLYSLAVACSNIESQLRNISPHATFNNGGGAGVRHCGSRTALGRGRGEAHLRPPGASGAGMVAERVVERESAPSQPAPARVPAAGQRQPQPHAGPWQKKRARTPPTTGWVMTNSRAAPAPGDCTTSGAARNMCVDQVFAFIQDLLSEGLVLAMRAAAAVELADVEVELERLGWTGKLESETQRSGGGASSSVVVLCPGGTTLSVLDGASMYLLKNPKRVDARTGHPCVVSGALTDRARARLVVHQQHAQHLY
jgi:hypothetical protein